MAILNEIFNSTQCDIKWPLSVPKPTIKTLIGLELIYTCGNILPNSPQKLNTDKWNLLSLSHKVSIFFSTIAKHFFRVYNQHDSSYATKWWLPIEIKYSTCQGPLCGWLAGYHVTVNTQIVYTIKKNVYYIIRKISIVKEPSEVVRIKIRFS